MNNNQAPNLGQLNNQGSVNQGINNSLPNQAINTGNAPNQVQGITPIQNQSRQELAGHVGGGIKASSFKPADIQKLKDSISYKPAHVHPNLKVFEPVDNSRNFLRFLGFHSQERFAVQLGLEVNVFYINKRNHIASKVFNSDHADPLMDLYSELKTVKDPRISNDGSKAPDFSVTRRVVCWVLDLNAFTGQLTIDALVSRVRLYFAPLTLVNNVMELSESTGAVIPFDDPARAPLFSFTVKGKGRNKRYDAFMFDTSKVIPLGDALMPISNVMMPFEKALVTTSPEQAKNEVEEFMGGSVGMPANNDYSNDPLAISNTNVGVNTMNLNTAGTVGGNVGTGGGSVLSTDSGYTGDGDIAPVGGVGGVISDESDASITDELQKKMENIE